MATHAGTPMPYLTHSIFYSLQGEGAWSGRPAVFVRFAGCNLWSGREQDRAAALCRFCDTDFVSTKDGRGGRFADPQQLVARIVSLWPDANVPPYVIFTGGEPALQLDAELITACHRRGFQVAVETNGTRSLPQGLDWVCVSPKPGTELMIDRGDELKLVYPVPGLHPQAYAGLAFRHFYLQPLDEGGEGGTHIAAALEYCLRHPQWSLSLQLHKWIGIE
ncbi:queuosine Biosynthesis QueE Radical SAM [Halorhodospira halochloris]|uniref:7-carboxy-7-deazaguanine synthase n=1 Tax=Halorhodospira halochloris TaxID=1052 RepID=A0A0X8X736_HALHR|nr:queuosine Biosynthesis QueE Radical SAM [Halorhodospira halochloris]